MENKVFSEPTLKIVRFPIEDIVATSTEESKGDNWQLPEL